MPLLNDDDTTLTPPTIGPDFSDIHDLIKARRMMSEGTLEKVFLMPLEFGGRDTPANTLYVPVGIAQIKRNIDINQIGPLVEDGEISEYTAEPEYRGCSFVPMAIKIHAWGTRQFTTQINIWGEALERETLERENSASV